MSEPPADATVGVVGDDQAVVDALEAAALDVVVGDVRTVADAAVDVVVAVGESSVLEAVRGGVTTPTLPVDAGRALRSVSRASVEAAAERLREGAVEAVHYPVLEVAAASTAVRVLQDAMLVTTEPARISEYAVRVDGERVGRFRADGVVVATPAGSQGYARAAGSPVSHPATEVLTAVPVSPFATDQDDWVLPMEGVELSVERDEAAVELLADDRSAGEIEAGEPVRVARDGTFPVAVVPESGDFFG